MMMTWQVREALMADKTRQQRIGLQLEAREAAIRKFIAPAQITGRTRLEPCADASLDALMRSQPLSSTLNGGAASAFAASLAAGGAVADTPKLRAGSARPVRVPGVASSAVRAASLAERPSLTAPDRLPALSRPPPGQLSKSRALAARAPAAPPPRWSRANTLPPARQRPAFA